MNTSKNDSVGIEQALSTVPTIFRSRLIQAYLGLKNAHAEGSFDASGLRAGRFAEVFLRWLQQELQGTHIPFGTKITNFATACADLEKTPKTAGHESTRILIPRALNFLYTLRNKRGIGHEGGDVDANGIDSSVAVSIADWCISELIRLKYSVSLEEAQAICDAVVTRKLPHIWEIGGKKRVLTPGLSYPEKTLLLLYSTPDTAVAVEDLLSWVEYSNPRFYRRDVLSRLHTGRLVEYDQDTQTISISPKGVEKVESELIGQLPKAGR